jgi:hypothetical protein
VGNGESGLEREKVDDAVGGGAGKPEGGQRGGGGDDGAVVGDGVYLSAGSVIGIRVPL